VLFIVNSLILVNRVKNIFFTERTRLLVECYKVTLVPGCVFGELI
jgi:hypothetical protein